MRPLKELLIILRYEFLKGNCHCLCKAAYNTHYINRSVSMHDYHTMIFYLNQNRPEVPGRPSSEYMYWWPIGEQTPRIEWLEQEISKL